MEFPMNERLVEETLRLKEERRVVRERMAKIEAQRGEVRAAVYERVHGDYAARDQELSAGLQAKKVEVDRELAGLNETRTKLSANVDGHREQLEEIHFRHGLGEFDDAAFQEKADAVGEKLAKFETLLNAVDTNIRSYERLFADELDLVTTATGPRAAPQPPEAPLTDLLADVADDDLMPDPLDEDDAAEPEAVAQTDYQLDASGGDYFGGVVPDESAPPRGSTSETSVYRVVGADADTEAGTERTPQLQHTGPLLRVSQGEGVGGSYPVLRETTIGRTDGNTIVLKEAKVSRQHAKITAKGKKWILTDLQSSNGVFVNGEQIAAPVELKDGDQLQIGDTTFEFMV